MNDANEVIMDDGDDTDNTQRTVFVISAIIALFFFLLICCICRPCDEDGERRSSRSERSISSFLADAFPALAGVSVEGRIKKCISDELEIYSKKLRRRDYIMNEEIDDEQTENVKCFALPTATSTRSQQSTKEGLTLPSANRKNSKNSLLALRMKNGLQQIKSKIATSTTQLSLMFGDESEKSSIMLELPRPGHPSRSKKSSARAPSSKNEMSQSGLLAQDDQDVESHRVIQSPQCAVCLSSIVPGDHISWSANGDCTHIFHKDCILEWFVASAKKQLRRNRGRNFISNLQQTRFDMQCPICRQDFMQTS